MSIAPTIEVGDEINTANLDSRTMLDFLESMKKSVLERPDGGLTLGRRHWLWNEVARQYPTDAYVRRAALGHLVCNQTVAAWESLSLKPTDKRLHHGFRALCRGVLLGELEHDAACKQFVDLDCHAQCVDFAGELNGFYALRAVRAACVDVIHPAPLPTPINIELTELEIDPDNFDPHFLASCIIAGGAAWEGSSDAGRRREFWIDWLEKLFPLAFSDPSELLQLVKRDNGVSQVG